MNRLFLYTVAIMFLILYNNHFCQLRPSKPVMTNNVEVRIVREKPKKVSKIITPKPIYRDEIIRTKPKRKIKHHNPPQRPQKHSDPPARISQRREVADFPIQTFRCRTKSRQIDYTYNDIIQIDEFEGDFVYQEHDVIYCMTTKFFDSKEFTDEDFPICIKGIEFEYLRNQWINSNDFPKYTNDKESGEYSVYSINFDVYVIEQSYDYPFAAQISFPDYSSEIVLFNLDSEYLEADSVYFFEEEIPLERTGYAWLTLGYYDFEYNQFYSAAFSPYLTKQKIYIPEPYYHNRSKL